MNVTSRVICSSLTFQVARMKSSVNISSHQALRCLACFVCSASVGGGGGGRGVRRGGGGGLAPSDLLEGLKSSVVTSSGGIDNASSRPSSSASTGSALFCSD